MMALMKRILRIPPSSNSILGAYVLFIGVAEDAICTQSSNSKDLTR